MRGRTRQTMKADSDLMKEADRQMDLNFASWFLALTRNWGYGKLRLQKCVYEMADAFSELEGDGDKSIIGLLDEETGIEMQIGDGTSWRDHPFLNGELWNGEPLDQYRHIYMRRQQIKWCSASIEATILLVMYRRYGWSAERDRRLLGQMKEIKCFYNYDVKKLKQALAEETEIKFSRTREGTIFIEPFFSFCKGCQHVSFAECNKCQQKIDYEIRYLKR